VTTFYRIVKFDAFVKNSQIRFSVIPVKTGIQSFQRFLCPACARMTTFCEIIKFQIEQDFSFPVAFFTLREGRQEP
jgi:hypothetical protein